MSSLQFFKQKIKSVGNIAKITKTMQMVSVSKMKKASQKAHSAAHFEKELSNISTVLDMKLSVFSKEEKKSLEKNEHKELLIVCSSNKGLCGGFHTQLYKFIHEKKSANSETTFEIFSLGKYAQKIAKKLELPVIYSFIDVVTNNSSDFDKEFEIITSLIMKLFLEKNYTNISFIGNNGKGMNVDVVETQCLPIKIQKQTQERKNNPSYCVEPTMLEVVEKVAREYITMNIYKRIMQSLEAEHIARMLAMQSASDNARTLRDNLKLTMNSIRQSAITSELSEILGAVSALED
jgi:F-type H+-transporting ATPase subunit gamma